MRRDGSRLRLSAFLAAAAALAGCNPRPTPPPATPPPVPLPPLTTTPGSVTLTAYLPLHPASTELRRLDAAIRRLSQPEAVLSPPTVPAPPIPQAVEMPIAPEPGAPPSLQANAVRAADAVAEDYALRKQAQPDTAGEQYQRDLNRLTRQYLEQRQQPREEDGAADRAESQRIAEESARLTAALLRLRERPGDRLLYGAVELERRRKEYSQTQARLEALRREEIAWLTARLNPEPSQRTPRIPPEEVKAAEKRRDEARAEAEATLRREEAAAVEAVRNTQLPPPTIELPPAPEASAAEPVPALLHAKPRVMPTENSRTQSRAGTLQALKAARTALLQQILTDLRTAALTAGREAGVDVTFTPGKAPDQTATLSSRVRRLVRWGRGGRTG